MTPPGSRFAGWPSEEIDDAGASWNVQGGPLVLDSLLAKLNASGVAVIVKPEWDMLGVGRFARIHDPEGNGIELWEPPAD